MTGTGEDYILHCTVCKLNCYSKHEWNQHLLGSLHQIRARIGVSQWDNQLRECALALFSTFPLDDNSLADIINFFSSQNVGSVTFVTDFILFPSPRLRTAVIQFESKKMVKQLFHEVGGPTVTIANQLVQIKRLDKYLELEWLELIACFQGGPDRNECQWTTGDASTPELLLMEPKLQDDRLISTEQTEPNDSRISMIDTAFKQGILTEQFQSIIQEMEIPDKEFNLVENVIQEMKRVMRESLPKYEVAMYRFNFLKLRNHSPGNTYSLFMYIDSDSKTSKGFVALSKEMMQPLQKYFTPGDGEDTIFNEFLVSEEDLRFAKEHGNAPPRHIIHKGTGLEIKFSSFPVSIGELQISRLVTYYCHFDQRIRPLLAILYYWTTINGITLGKEKISYMVTPMKSPDPAALEWLLLFFLYHNEKVVPSPEEITNRPHKLLKLSSGEKALDLGFDFDLEFAKSWKKCNGIPSPPMEGTEDFVISVLKLAQGCFQFYGETLETPCVIKLSNGTTFPRADENGCLRLTIIHPLAPKWKLSVGQEKWRLLVRPAMRETGEKLQQLITLIENSTTTENNFVSASKLRDALHIKH